MTSPPSNNSTQTLLGWLAMAAVITVASLRCLVAFVPELWFDTDAMTDATRSLSFGPAGAVVLDALAIFALLLAIIDAAKRHQRVYLLPISLWMLGTGLALYHGRADAESMRLGLNWASALAIAIAAFHLGADGLKRRMLIGALIALLAPLGLHAGYQVAVVHPDTVAKYEANREEALAQRGIALGSEAQRKFEQRLFQREASGRVGLSNVLGSLLMTLTLLAMGVSLALFKSKQNPATQFTMIAITLLGIGALALTFSKGALLAMGAAGGATLVAWFAFKKLRTHRHAWGTLAIAIVLFGFIAVILRGAAGPPDTAAGERSLLFRYHYWQGAAQMLAEQPITGVGPARFGELYLTHKNPISPEDINDPHNTIVSFVSTLGVGGIAWAGLLLLLIYKAARPLTQVQNTTQLTDAQPSAYLPAILIGVAASLGSLVTPLGLYQEAPAALLLVLVIAAIPTLLGVKVLRNQQPAMGATLIALGPIVALALLPEAGIWFAGLVALIALMIAFANAPALDTPFARLGLFAAAVAALLHSQIEMNLTHAMTAPPIALLLGLAAACPSASSSSTKSLLSFISPALVAITLVAALWLGVMPILNQQAHLASSNAAMVRGDYSSALNTHLPAAAQILADPRIEQRQAKIYLDLAVLTHQKGDAARTATALGHAIKSLEAARQHGLQLGQLWRAEANLAHHAALMTGKATWHTAAADAAAAMLPFMPHDTSAHVLAGELAVEAGRVDQAITWYNRALELDEQMWLDPTKQLPQAEREQLVKRVAALRP